MLYHDLYRIIYTHTYSHIYIKKNKHQVSLWYSIQSAKVHSGFNIYVNNPPVGSKLVSLLFFDLSLWLISRERKIQLIKHVIWTLSAKVIRRMNIYKMEFVLDLYLPCSYNNVLEYKKCPSILSDQLSVSLLVPESLRYWNHYIIGLHCGLGINETFVVLFSSLSRSAFQE